MSLQTGDAAPDFNLPNANVSIGGEHVSFSDAAGASGTLVLFECNHCPYVVASVGRINDMATSCIAKGIGFVGINSNDPVKYEADSWDNMVKRSQRGMTYPYLHDEDQTVATSYGAERTPEFYLVSSSGVVVYRGRMDDSPRDPSHATTNDLSEAIDDYVSGRKISNPRTESIGCSVKWKD